MSAAFQCVVELAMENHALMSFHSPAVSPREQWNEKTQTFAKNNVFFYQNDSFVAFTDKDVC